MTDLTDSIRPSLSIGSVEFYFYRLLWQPAALMHVSWWRALDLEGLRLIYQTTPRARPSINRSILQRRISMSRSFAALNAEHAASVSELTSVEKKVLGYAEKLPVLIPALGLLRLARAEYWMLRDYRDALPEFSAIDRTQLNVLAAPLMNASVPDNFRLELPLLDPAHLAEQATVHGAAVLTSALKERPLLGVLEVLFEPAIFEKSPAISEPAASFGLNTLFRLARFL